MRASSHTSQRDSSDFAEGTEIARFKESCGARLASALLLDQRRHVHVSNLPQSGDPFQYQEYAQRQAGDIVNRNTVITGADKGTPLSPTQRNWTQVTYSRVPYARENGGLAWDPSTQMMVVFGGYAGQQYLSDLWTLTADRGWQPQITNPIKRRPTARP